MHSGIWCDPRSWNVELTRVLDHRVEEDGSTPGRPRAGSVLEEDDERLAVAVRVPRRCDQIRPSVELPAPVRDRFHQVRHLGLPFRATRYPPGDRCEPGWSRDEILRSGWNSVDSLSDPMRSVGGTSSRRPESPGSTTAWQPPTCRDGASAGSNEE